MTGVEVDADDFAGPMLVRLSLAPGTDETVVSMAVHPALMLRFGPALGPVRIEVDDSSAADLHPPRHLREGQVAAGRHGGSTYALLATHQEDFGLTAGP
ncbi:MAG TPA: hypothetical protein VIJ41_17715, partial [Candidatus Nanopelagicales bacterium]